MKTLYTLVETSKHDLGKWEFKFNPDFQDVVEYWVSVGASRKEMEKTVNNCIQSFDLDSREDTQKVLNSISLSFTSDNSVLREIMKAAVFHRLPLERIDKCIMLYFTEENEALKLDELTKE